MTITRLGYYTILSSFLLLLQVGAHAWFPHRLLQTAITTMLVFFWSLLLGATLLPRKRPLVQWIAGLTGVWCLLMILTAGTYFLYRMTWIESYAVLIGTGVIIHLLARRVELPPYRSYLRRLIKQLILHYWFSLVSLLVVALSVLLLIHLTSSGTLGSIRTPWQFIDQPLFFLGVTLVAVLLGFLAWKKSPALRPLPMILFMLVFTAVGMLIYKTGYGFDPFVHRATELHIFNHGTITPKPLWYLGQHAFIVALAHLTALPIVWIDKLLLPLSSALLITGWLYVLAPRSWHRRALLFLLLPLLSWFTGTTPQGIANLLYVVLVIELLLFAKRKISVLLPLLTVLAIATLHPATALPALILFTLTLLTKRGMRLRFSTPLALLAGFSLPALFLINEWRSLHLIPSFIELYHRGLENIAHLGVSLAFLQNSFYGFANALYTFRSVVMVFAACATLYGIYTLRYKPLLRPYLLTSGALLIAAILIYLFNKTPLVISYEQNDFALRTLWLVGFTLLPFFMYGGLAFWRQIRLHRMPVQIIVIILMACGVATNLYLLYPRVDRMENARGYSTGLADIAAVEFIDRQNPEGNYVVLANQSVSAAALRALGFKYEFKTTDGSVYFYPIPTGGTLYSYFLKMIDGGPTTTTAEGAMNYTGAGRVYFVLNNYWWRDYRIADVAQKNADWWTTLPGGAITIFGWQQDKTRAWDVP